MLGTVAAAVGIALAAYVAWRWTSVARGRRQRDEKLLAQLDPIGKKVDTGETIAPEEIDALAARPEIRHMLFTVLREMGRADLLPKQYSSTAEQGASALAYWMMHPNELQDAPERIELVETVTETVDGKNADFFVYRFRMPDGHWAGAGWLLGLAGPMAVGEEPYTSLPAAFSRAGDEEGKIRPRELVAWYVGMLRQKGIVR